MTTTFQHKRLNNNF